MSNRRCGEGIQANRPRTVWMGTAAGTPVGMSDLHGFGGGVLRIRRIAAPASPAGSGPAPASEASACGSAAAGGTGEGAEEDGIVSARRGPMTDASVPGRRRLGGWPRLDLVRPVLSAVSHRRLKISLVPEGNQ